jgi:demethylmenaquinone methyltransferase/2-methoxy-6-polyprenyl-1,4-benzoquinol methylase
MIEIARSKALRRSANGHVHFQAGDALRLPFRDESFDACAVAFGIRNVSDPARGISEMVRVVRPGGRAVILEFTLPEHPLLRNGYLLYFRHLLPLIGRWISRSKIDAYRYLPDSVELWPAPEAFKRQLEAAGLRDVSYERLFGGMAAIHTGVKGPRACPPRS